MVIVGSERVRVESGEKEIAGRDGVARVSKGRKSGAMGGRKSSEIANPQTNGRVFANRASLAVDYLRRIPIAWPSSFCPGVRYQRTRNRVPLLYAVPSLISSRHSRRRVNPPSCTPT